MNEVMKTTVARSQAMKRTSSRVEFNWLTVTMMVLVLLSAFAVVYVKDLNRRLFMQYQQLQSVHNQLYVNWGKLLLEQSTLAAQQRVQNVAEHRLHMVVPKQVVMVRD